MFFLILLFTIPFLFVAFSQSEFVTTETNPILTFLQYQYFVFSSHIAMAFVIILVVSATSLFFLRFDDAYRFSQKAIYALLHTLSSLLCGFIFSFILLFSFALLQLTLMSLLLRVNPHLLGVTRDPAAIITALQHVRTLPDVIATENDSRVELQALVSATSGRNTFYSTWLLPSIPAFLILPMPKSGASIQLLDNTLIITTINKNDIEPVSPILGLLFVRNYFRNRPLRYYPQVSIMDRKEYLARRDLDTNMKIETLKNKLTDAYITIASTSAVLALDQPRLATLSATLENDKKKSLSLYERCLGEGVNQGGTFVKIHTKDYCQLERTDRENQFTATAKEITVLSKKISDDQQMIKQNSAIITYLKQLYVGMQQSKVNFLHELGVFDPQNSIKIAVDTTSSHTIADYLETLTHEYLHYASYVSEKKRFSELFFEEGLTEYFARQAISEDLHISTNLGYPAFVRIIAQMTKVIPESELADIYFTKDQEGLQKTLDRVYGDGFYENNKVLFTSFQYVSNNQQLLTLTNEVMRKIGGPQLTAKDLMSSFSNF